MAKRAQFELLNAARCLALLEQSKQSICQSFNFRRILSTRSDA
jgi:hypothetical protein